MPGPDAPLSSSQARSRKKFGSSDGAAGDGGSGSVTSSGTGATWASASTLACTTGGGAFGMEKSCEV